MKIGHKNYLWTDVDINELGSSGLCSGKHQKQPGISDFEYARYRNSIVMKLSDLSEEKNINSRSLPIFLYSTYSAFSTFSTFSTYYHIM